MKKPASERAPSSPAMPPDVATEPHPTANAIPEPPGAGDGLLEEVVSDVREADQPGPERPRKER